ncbi:MAG: aspartate aminotransferase family protein [Myxococcota bacterium]
MTEPVDSGLPSWPFIPAGRGPLAIERAEGPWLITPDGRRILDAAGGAIVASLGHGRREVAEAVAEALRNASYVVPPFATPERERLVRRLRERWLPSALTRVYLASGGSEAVDAAIRIARQHHVAAGHPERTEVLSRRTSYHGATLSTLALGGHVGRRAGLEPLLPPEHKLPACYCLRCPLGLAHPGCAIACASRLEESIDALGPGRVAAFVAEPIVGSSGGALVPPEDYWPRIGEICRRHGVLLIADEVMTGFGRTGRRFAIEHFGIEPDLLVSGKGLAAGYAPICGVFATEAVVEPLARSGADVMFYTYGAHPAACAAADRVLEILEVEKGVEAAERAGAQLRARLSSLEGHPHVAEIRGRGLLIAVELVRDRQTLEPFAPEARLTQRVVAAGLRRDVFFYPGGSGEGRSVVLLGPPFDIGPPELEQMAAALEAAIDEACARCARD